MGLATSKYDLSLNGQGYLMVEESYKERSQQPFTARFATGDPGLGDLSFWQFLGMTDFSGGQGQETFTSTTKIKGSVGWDFRDGKPRLSLGHSRYGSAAVGYGGTVGAVPSFASQFVKRQKAIAWGTIGGTSDAIVCVGSGNSSSVSQLIGIGSGTYESFFVQTGATDGVIWQRSQHGTWLATVSAGNLYLHDGAIANPHNPTHTIAIAGLGFGKILIPLDENTIVIVDQSFTTGAIASIRTVKLDNNAATIATNLGTVIPYENQYLAGAHAIDSDGAVYIASVPYTLAQLADTVPPLASSIHVFSAADLVKTNGPSQTREYRLNNFLVGGLISSGGTVYALGALRKSSTAQVQAIINVVTQAIVWESPYEYASATADNIICQYFQQNPSECYFFARNYLGNYDSLMRFRLGVVDEVWCVPRSAAGTVDLYCPCFTGNRFYYLHRTNDKIYRSTVTRGGLGTATTEAILETSSAGGNTPLINKMPYSVTVELSSAMLNADVMTVRLNGSDIGTMAAADGASKTFTITADLTATSFNIRLVCAETVLWEGYVKQILLKYIPVQFKKKMWGFGVRATKALKLIDGSMETTTSSGLFSAIKEAWASNIPVTFIDIDGQSHTVIVTEYDRRVPLPDRRGGTNVEQLCFVELLEV